MIRNAQKGDIVALSELAIETYTAAFGHTFSPADLAAHLQRHLTPDCFARILDEDVVLVAEFGNRLLGYVQFGAADSAFRDETTQELRRLYVHPEFQNQDIGAALMESALLHPQMQAAKAIVLDVWEHNQGAQRFYRRYGFEVIGARAFEVESGAETSLDLIMARHSPSEP